MNAKPVEADEHVGDSDVLGAPYLENEPCCRILHRLKTANQVDRQPSQHAVQLQ